jgi:hypothetical protein
MKSKEFAVAWAAVEGASFKATFTRAEGSPVIRVEVQCFNPGSASELDGIPDKVTYSTMKPFMAQLVSETGIYQLKAGHFPAVLCDLGAEVRREVNRNRPTRVNDANPYWNRSVA